MDNSRVIEILSMVVDSLEQIKSMGIDSDFSSGVCGHLSNLYYLDIITLNERDEVKTIIWANKPNDKQFTKFTEGKYWTGNIFWWIPISQERRTAPIRAKFVKELIIKLNKN